MKRLLAVVLICLLLLCSCKQNLSKEGAAAAYRVEKDSGIGENSAEPSEEVQDPVDETQNEEGEKVAEKEEPEGSNQSQPPPQKEETSEKAPADEGVGEQSIRVEYSEKNAMERLTEGELGKLFEYDIFYLGIKNFYITVDGKEIELRQALARDPAIIDTLYKEWKEDHGSRYAYYDGGSVQYPYEAYTAYRVIFPTNNPDRDRERDLVLCREGNLNEIKEKIDKKRGYKDVYYIASALGEENPPAFNLDRYGWFAFNFGSVAEDGVLGTYREEGNKLILQAKGEREDRFTFERTEAGYCYLAEESSSSLSLPSDTLFSLN